LILVLNPCYAEETAPSSGVTIVNGKKFFPLSRARHFLGSGATPSGLLTLHRAKASNLAQTASSKDAAPHDAAPHIVKPLFLHVAQNTPEPALLNQTGPNQARSSSSQAMTPDAREKARRDVLSIFAAPAAGSFLPHPPPP
jgi:hypothetical protein